MRKTTRIFLCGMLIMTMLIGTAMATTTSEDRGNDVLFFAGDTPAKNAPLILGIIPSDGSPLGDVVFVDEDTDQSVEDDDCLLITAASKRRYSTNVEIGARLDGAMNDILLSSSVLELKPKQVSDKEEEQKTMRQLIEENTDLGIELEHFDALELFDVTGKGKSDQFFHTFGNYLDITFDVKIKYNERLLVMQTVDGSLWEVIPSEDVIVNYEESVMVRVRKQGALGFFVAPIEEAARPSATGSLVPFVEYTRKIFSEEGYAITYLPKGGFVNFDPEQTLVLASAVAYREDAPIPEITERLIKAFDSIRQIPYLPLMPLQRDSDATRKIVERVNLGRKDPIPVEEITLEDCMWQVLEDMGSAENPDDLIVRDLFDMTAFGEAAKYLAEDEENALDVKFDVQMPEGTTFVVMVSPDGINWSVLPAEYVLLVPNEYLIVRMYDLGAVAFCIPIEDSYIS